MRLSSRWLSAALLTAMTAGLISATIPISLVLVSLVAGLAVGVGFRSPMAGLAAALICLCGWLGGSARLQATGPGLLLNHTAQQVEVEGQFATPLRRAKHGSTAVATLSRPAKGKVLLQLNPSLDVSWAAQGSTFDAKVKLRAIAGRSGDFYRSLERKGVHFTASVAEVQSASRSTSALSQVRQRAGEAASAGLSGDVAALAKGITLGDDSAMTEATEVDFKRSGLSHLTAVSGANILLLILLLHWVLGLLGVRIAARFWITVASVIGYAVICGGSPSVVRACAMGVCSLVAGFAGRASSRAHALAFAAVALLLIDPWAHFDPGAQLSFAAVVGIFLFARGIRERLPPGFEPFPEALAVTLSATAATAPILAWHFDEVSLTAIPANVLVVFAIAPATWMGFLAATLGQVWGGAALLINAVAQFPLGFVLDVARVFASPSWATFESSPLQAAALVMIPIVAFAFVPRTWLTLKAIPLVAAVAAILVFTVAEKRAENRIPHNSVTALDIGQGDAILLRGAPGCDVLIDAGPVDGRAANKLRVAGVKRLSALVITHAARDHHGAAAQVIQSVKVDRLIDGGGSSRDELLLAARSAASRDNAQWSVMQSGLHHQCSGVEMRALWPPRPASEMSLDDPNLSSGVFLARVDDVTVLLTSDAESEVLQRIDLPRIDILKVSHHGSADPGLPALLKRITPRLAIVSSGPNSYGHPTAQAIAALRAMTLVRQTAKEGNVTIRADSGP